MKEKAADAIIRLEEMVNIIYKRVGIEVISEEQKKSILSLIKLPEHPTHTLANVFYPDAKYWAECADISALTVGDVYKRGELLCLIEYLPIIYGNGISDSSFTALLKHLRKRGIHIERLTGKSGYYCVKDVYSEKIPYAEFFAGNLSPGLALAADYIAKQTYNGNKDHISYFVSAVPNSMDDVQPTVKELAKSDSYAHIFRGDLASINRDIFVSAGFERLANNGLLELDESRFVLVDESGEYHRMDSKAQLANNKFADELIQAQQKGNYFRMPKRKSRLLQKMRCCPGLDDVADYYIERVATINNDVWFQKLLNEEKRSYAATAHKAILEKLEQRYVYHTDCADSKKCAPERERIAYKKCLTFYKTLVVEEYPEYFEGTSATA